MSIIAAYLRYLEELGAGQRTPPEGIVLTQEVPLARAAELQAQIQSTGVPEFVRRCAAADGEVLPEAWYADYSDEKLLAALSALAQRETEQELQTEQAPEAEPEQFPEPPKIEEPDGSRNACEVLLDCCLLDESLMQYLIDICKRGDDREFQRLALVTTRKAFLLADFLSWFAEKPKLASQEEQVCVLLMDACMDRLAADGQKELMAALLSGDETTFSLFRCEAPELMHMPQATYAWYETYYLQSYYPVRYLLKYNGIKF
mgnify:CR=1 FL=1